MERGSAAALAASARRLSLCPWEPEMEPVPSLPVGAVTFLFTDIGGSTRLWEQQPEAMPAVLARHDALLTTGIQQHGGQVVKSRGEGDSLFAVFADASEAVAAACA